MDYPDSSQKLVEKVRELETALQQAREKLQGGKLEVKAHEGLLKLAIDDMRQVYEDLLKTHSQLMQSDKLAAIGLLSAGVIHEIKSPLMSIQLVFYLLGEKINEMERLNTGSPEESKALLDETKKFLNQGMQCTAIISKIVQDIRIFSRSDKGKMMLEDVNTVLEGVIGIASTAFKDKAELKKSYGELPMVLCNPQQLSQVFLNLLMNASQAIEEHGTISVRTFLDGPWVRVEIADTGSGIPEDIQSRMFEPFFTTKDAETGTGLGLSISADIVKNHGGTITVKSQVGQGATFTISLPVAAP